jgi:Tfp pilus assembly protein PilO
MRFAAVVVVFAAYVFVFRGGEGHIASQLDQNERLVERVHAAEHTLAARPRIEAQRTRLRDRLRTVELDAGRSALVARFLRETARIAATYHATIATITAAAATTASPTNATTASTTSALGATATTAARSNVVATAGPEPEPLEALPLDITVEGSYTDVLAMIRALSRTRVLAAVDVASLARKHADGEDATLTAALHVQLERRARPEAAPADTAPSAGLTDVRAARS